eukprot:TRINITY_DN12140_c0_g1_i1.p1 TRINITY_DN12140_c0_g1~~TRINITY_DN12140_c0_g1_i1.p1  ORF type:complete len:473 (+),score=98.71 TRINITY_DN12140_c0_g1_i1:82-1419(+)
MESKRTHYVRPKKLDNKVKFVFDPAEIVTTADRPVGQSKAQQRLSGRHRRPSISEDSPTPTRGTQPQSTNHTPQSQAEGRRAPQPRQPPRPQPRPGAEREGGNATPLRYELIPGVKVKHGHLINRQQPGADKYRTTAQPPPVTGAVSDAFNNNNDDYCQGGVETPHQAAREAKEAGRTSDFSNNNARQRADKYPQSSARAELFKADYGYNNNHQGAEIKSAMRSAQGDGGAQRRLSTRPSASVLLPRQENLIDPQPQFKRDPMPDCFITVNQAPPSTARAIKKATTRSHAPLGLKADERMFAKVDYDGDFLSRRVAQLNLGKENGHGNLSAGQRPDYLQDDRSLTEHGHQERKSGGFAKAGLRSHDWNLHHGKCICERDFKLVFCESCYTSKIGRIMKQCESHPDSQYLMDINKCTKCKSSQLKEYDVPPSIDISQVKNKLIEKN